jgi:AAA domain
MRSTVSTPTGNPGNKVHLLTDEERWQHHKKTERIEQQRRAPEISATRVIAHEEGCSFDQARCLYHYRNPNRYGGTDLSEAERDWCEGYEKARGKNEADRIFAQFSRPGDARSPRQRKSAQPSATATATPHVWRDPASILPRDFLYGDCIIRRYVSAVISMGGVGKTSEMQVEVAAMVTGRDLLGVKPKRPLRVWYINLEDGQDEIDRRLGAIFKHYEIAEDDLAGHLFTDSGREKNFVIADDDRAGLEFHEDVIAEISANIRKNAIDLVVVDPFVLCARFPENDNNKMAQIIEAWAQIAQQCDCAVVLVHHVRKGSSGQGSYTVEDARGAGAIINSCRSVRILNSMTKEEGKQAVVERHRSYFRIDSGKTNVALPPDVSEWRRIISVDLDNASGDCPADRIGVVTLWKWPDPMEDLTVAHPPRSPESRQRRRPMARKQPGKQLGRQANRRRPPPQPH